jgi:hypothetical protein
VVLSALRDAAALFVEAGKALGHLEHSRETEKTLALLLKLAQFDVDKPEGMPVIQAFADHRQRLADTLDRVRAAQGSFERVAQTHRDRAAELVEELEQPGATLARRLVAVALAARAAWRGSR